MSEQTKTILEAISSPMTFPCPPRADVYAQIDLVNQRQVLVIFGVLDFIDPDGIDLAEHPVLQPEGDHVFDGVENPFP